MAGFWVFDPGYEWFLGGVRAHRLYDAGYAMTELRVEVSEQRIGAIIGLKMVQNAIRAIGTW